MFLRFLDYVLNKQTCTIFWLFCIKYVWVDLFTDSILVMALPHWYRDQGLVSVAENVIMIFADLNKLWFRFPNF